jgi:membrane-associated phospholipid phosphatase
VDRVQLGFHGFVLAVALVRAGTLPNPLRTFAWYGAVMVGTVALAAVLRRASGLRGTVPRVLFAFAVSPVSYLMLGDVVPYVIPWGTGERMLRAIDDALFLGHNPNELLDRMTTPWLTEVLQIDYAFYYLITIFLFVFLLVERRHAGAERATFLVMLCLFLSYVGYFVVPATGPNMNVHGLYPSHFSEPMEGLWMAERIREALFEAEAIKHDCWPSGHTALTVTCLLVARREGSRLAFWSLLVPVVLLIFATMYLRYHYVVDVLFGFLLAWATMRFGPRLYARMRRPTDAPAIPPPPATTAA